MKGVSIMKAKEAIALIKNGDLVSVGIFFQAGFPVDLGHALAESGVKNIRLITNDPGLPNVGVGEWLINEQISSLTCSYPGTNPDAMRLIREGKLDVSIIPQGTLVEMLRALGSGIGGFYVRTGLDAYAEMKKINLPSNVKVYFGQKKERIGGKEWLFVPTFSHKPKFALVRAEVADTNGTLLFRGTATNFGPIVAGCADTVIVEVDRIVKPGQIIPGHHELVLPPNYARNKILVKSSGEKISPWLHKGKGGKTDLATFMIVKRALQEIKLGDVINPGIGIPSEIRNQKDFLKMQEEVLLQVECGALGIGPRPVAGSEHSNFIDAAGEPFSRTSNLTIFHSADAFAQIRGGKVPKVFLGGLQVGMKSVKKTSKADLSNWWMYDDKVKKDLNGIGGAMDLAQAVKDNEGCELIVLMKHVGPKGEKKIMDNYTFPVTAKAVVSKIITDKCVIEITKKGPVVTELMPWEETFESVQAATGTKLIKAKNLKKVKV